MADKKNPYDDVSGKETTTGGTQIRVEQDVSKKHRAPIWPWILGLVIIGLLAWPFLTRSTKQAAVPPAPAPQTHTTTTTAAAPVGPGLVYQGTTYKAHGTPVSVASSNMVAVGKSNGGSTIYKSAGGGGGAGAPETLYVKTKSGEFQPLAPVTP